ncbi:MAG: hypothetical protein ACRDJE_13120 [Dehalococcoidia bacterium]
MNVKDGAGLAEMDRIYERYGKPLEAEHWGEFLAVAPDGRTLLAPTLQDAVYQSVERFGRGGFVFKVGEQAVGRI